MEKKCRICLNFLNEALLFLFPGTASLDKLKNTLPSSSAIDMDKYVITTPLKQSLQSSKVILSN